MKIDIPDYDEREKAGTQIVIHSVWDTWDMDPTLALIILPMLVQLKETKYGHSKITEERWNEILDEMIWAFKQKWADDWNDLIMNLLLMMNLNG